MVSNGPRPPEPAGHEDPVDVPLVQAGNRPRAEVPPLTAPTQLLVERTRGALLVLLALIAAFPLIEGDWRQPWTVYVLKGAHALLVVTGLMLLRRTAVGIRLARAVAFAMVVGSFTLIAAGDVLTQHAEAVPLVAVVCAMVAAALLPWGFVAQLACALTLGVIAWGLLAVAEASIARLAFPVLWVTLAISVYVARELERHRRVGQEADAARSRSLAELARVNQLKSDFVALVSHELRTPLNVIAGYAEMLEDPECGERSLALRRIRAANVELLDLVDATLSVERLDSGRDTPSLEPFAFDALLAELAEELDSVARERGLALLWPAPAGVREIRSDRRKVKTIIKNLVGNALKFTPAGEVELTYRVEGAALELAVRDTGIGIPREKIREVFERFAQLGDAVGRSRGGFGLGLHIARTLCEQLGGRIEVESAVGRGTTFTVNLPIGLPARPDERSPARPENH